MPWTRLLPRVSTLLLAACPGPLLCFLMQVRLARRFPPSGRTLARLGLATLLCLMLRQEPPQMANHFGALVLGKLLQQGQIVRTLYVRYAALI